MKAQAGFTLVEAVAVLALLGMGTAFCIRALSEKAAKRADIIALKDALATASRKSLVEASHYGVHYDSASGTVSLFEDQDGDDAFSSGDTLESAFRLNRGAAIRVADSDSLGLADIVFKKNGAVAAGVSFSIAYAGVMGDTTGMQVFAASGRVLESGP